MNKEEAQVRSKELHLEIDNIYKVWSPLLVIQVVFIVLNILLPESTILFSMNVETVVQVILVVSGLGLIWSSLKIRKCRKEQDRILAEHGIW